MELIIFNLQRQKWHLNIPLTVLCFWKKLYKAVARYSVMWCNKCGCFISLYWNVYWLWILLYCSEFWLHFWVKCKQPLIGCCCFPLVVARTRCGVKMRPCTKAHFSISPATLATTVNNLCSNYLKENLIKSAVKECFNNTKHPSLQTGLIALLLENYKSNASYLPDQGRRDDFMPRTFFWHTRCHSFFASFIQAGHKG